MVANYVHIVFSTKHRYPFIVPEIEEELHRYLGSECNRLECYVVKVGGYTDHIHILCMLSRKIPLMKLLEDVKSHSSKWIKTKGDAYREFYWQDGYGAFSVNQRDVESVIAYITNQHQHHKDESFKDEYLGILKKYKVAYDERYVWE